MNILLSRRLVSIAALCLLLLSQSAQSQTGLSERVQGFYAKAKAGDAQSAFLLASAYDTGNGAPRDAQQALIWYRLSAEKGFAEAQNSLGSGLQAAKQYTEALKWYEQAAAQNHPLATNNLAYLYDLGLGVKQDRQKAFELYGKAADLGWAESMWNLANMYGSGQLGGPPDLPSACMWVARADKFATPSETRLKAALERIKPYLASKLSSEEQSKCNEAAQSWHPSRNQVP